MGVGAKKKGYIKNKSTGEVKSFLFNPEAFSDSRPVNFSEISAPGSSYPKFQYVNGGARSMSIDLFLSDTKKGTTKSYLTFLDGFLPKGSKFSKPPVLIFAMGSMVKQCILTQIDRTFTEFDPKTLELTRATVTLNLSLLEP